MLNPNYYGLYARLSQIWLQGKLIQFKINIEQNKLHTETQVRKQYWNNLYCHAQIEYDI